MSLRRVIQPPFAWLAAKQRGPKARSSAPRLLLALFALALSLAHYGATAATLLPNGKQTFLDASGNPLASGFVYFYLPTTSTPKNTWQDPGQTTLNVNPVHLDASGTAVIYGSGSYRQVVTDAFGTQIWDELTSDGTGSNAVWGSTSGGSANAQTVTASGWSAASGQLLEFLAGFTNTGATTVTVNGTSYSVRKGTLGGIVALTGGEITAGNVVLFSYDGSFLQEVSNLPLGTGVFGPLTTLASAATTDLGTIPSHNVSISGTATISAFGSSASTNYPRYNLVFTGASVLTYNATSLILPGSQSRTMAAGDTAQADYLGSGNWRVANISPASGQALITTSSSPPTGRLTFTSATPVLVSDVTAATSIFYTPYVGNQVPIWNGTAYVSTTFSELTIALQAATHAANSNYDIFLAADGATLRACTGPAWTSDTGRGTGGGTTQISYQLGLLTNTVSITCSYSASSFSVAAGYGTYVGTFRTTGTLGTTAWQALPAAAAGGGNGFLGLWNMYNRVLVVAVSRDSTDSWNYSTATWRSADNNTLNRITIIKGLNEDAATASYVVAVNNNAGTGTTVYCGVGLDSTSAYSGTPGNQLIVGSSAAGYYCRGDYNGLPGLGMHYFQALEYSIANGTTTWYGDNGAPLLTQMALQMTIRM